MRLGDSFTLVNFRALSRTIFNLRALSVILVNLRALSVTCVHPRAFLSNLSLIKYFLRAMKSVSPVFVLTRREFKKKPRVSRSDQKATVVSVVVDWPGLKERFY